MDECLESGILLYTLNFATARPIYSFHVRLYADTSKLYHGPSATNRPRSPRRARQVCFSQFLLDTLPRAAGPYTGVLHEVGIARPDKVQAQCIIVLSRGLCVGLINE